MYSPNLFTNDLFKLWNSEEEDLTWDSVRHGIRGNQQAEALPTTGTTTTNNNSTAEQLLDEHRKYLRSLFAPPLSAYSADYPGARTSHLDYTIQTATSIPSIRGPNSGVSNTQASTSVMANSTAVSRRLAYMNMNTPLTQMKIEQLEQIRNTGYTSIRPIGVERTMEEVDLEEARKQAAAAAEQQYDDPSYIHTTENEQAEGLVQANTSNVNSTVAEVDLDAGVMNADEEEENLRDEEFEDDDQEQEDSSGYLGDESRIRIAAAEAYDDAEDEDDSRILGSMEPEEAVLRTRGRFGYGTNLRSSVAQLNNISRPPIEIRAVPSQAPPTILPTVQMHSNNLVDEGFMADEVEYQNDHSTVDPSLHQMLMNSGSSANTNINSGRSMETAVTSTGGTNSGYRIREDGEESDLDMVIEE